MKYDFVVIGAGVSGMTASLVLAKNGFRTALVERSSKIAPLIRGFIRKNIYFDTGFHYAGGLHPGGPLDIFFKYLGIADHVTPLPLDADGFDVFRFQAQGREFGFPVGFERFKVKLCNEFPNDVEAIDSYLGAIKKGAASLPYLNLDEEPGFQHMMRFANDRTLKDFLDGATENLLLKNILSLHSILHGVAPSEVSLAYHSSIVGPYYESAYGVGGGGAELVNAFEIELKNLGVDLYCGQGADRIVFSSGGKVKGVRLTGGETVECGGCISTVHPHFLPLLLPEELFRRSFFKRIRALTNTPSAHILYCGCDSMIPALDNSNILLCGKLHELDGLLDQGALEERPVYIAPAKPVREGRLKSGFVAICPAQAGETVRWNDSFSGKRPEDYETFKSEIAERLLCRINNELPGVNGSIEVLDSATPLTIRDYANNPDGNLYGVKHRVGQYAPMPVTKAEGLFLAGQSIVAPGILGAMTSSFIVCGRIIGQALLLEELRKCA